MTLLRISNSTEQILVAEHDWTEQDMCLIPDVGQEKSCLSFGHQTMPERKKLQSYEEMSEGQKNQFDEFPLVTFQ